MIQESTNPDHSTQTNKTKQKILSELRILYHLSGFALQVLENLVLDPVPVLRVVLIGAGIEYQPTDVVQVVNVLVEVRHVIGDVLDGGVQLLQLVLVHLDDGCEARERRRE